MDHAELVAVRVEQHGVAVRLTLAERGAERGQPADLRIDVIGLDVDMEAALGGLLLRDPLEKETQTSDHMAERDIDLRLRVASRLRDAERRGPERQPGKQIVAVDDEAANSRSVHDSSSG